jgi:hypothetical protein
MSRERVKKIGATKGAGENKNIIIKNSINKFYAIVKKDTTFDFE